MRKALAGVLFVIVVLPSLCAFMTLAAVNSWLFNPSFYAGMIGNTSIYEAIIQELNGEGRDLVSEMPAGITRDFMLSFSDPAFLSQQISLGSERIINAAFTGESITEIYFDFAPVREALMNATPMERQAFLAYWPSQLTQCPPDVSGYRDGVLLPYCIPQGETRESVTAALIANDEQVISSVPDQLSYGIPLGNNETFAGLREARASFGNTVLTLALFSLVVWFVVAFVFASQPRGRFRWLGVTLAVPAVLLVLASILFSQSVLGLVSQITSTAVSQVDRAVGDTISGGFSAIGTSFFMAGLIPAVIGVLLFAYGTNAAFAAAVRGVRGAGEKIKNVDTSGITEKAKTGLSSATDKARGGINSAVENVSGRIPPDAAEKAKAGLSSATDKARSGINSAVENVSGRIPPDAAEKAKAGLSSATDKARSGISSAVGNVSNRIPPDAADKAREGFGRFAGNVRNAVNARTGSTGDTPQDGDALPPAEDLPAVDSAPVEPVAPAAETPDIAAAPPVDSDETAPTDDDKPRSE